MGKLKEIITRHLFASLVLLIAIVGGIPGSLSIYKYYTERPKVAMSIVRIDYGELEWPDKPKKYSYVLLELEVTNEEDHSIPLPLKPFNMQVKVNNKWVSFEKMVIPLSGTVLYSSEQDRTGANIDHMDLQKFRELNVSRLYGHFPPSIRKKAQYLNSKHYLLFQSTEVSLQQLQTTFENFNDNDNIPIKISWRDVRGRTHEPFLVIHKTPKITSDCYKVYSKKVLYF